MVKHEVMKSYLNVQIDDELKNTIKVRALLEGKKLDVMVEELLGQTMKGYSADKAMREQDEKLLKQ